MSAVDSVILEEPELFQSTYSPSPSTSITVPTLRRLYHLDYTCVPRWTQRFEQMMEEVSFLRVHFPKAQLEPPSPSTGSVSLSMTSSSPAWSLCFLGRKQRKFTREKRRERENLKDGKRRRGPSFRRKWMAWGNCSSRSSRTLLARTLP